VAWTSETLAKLLSFTPGFNRVVSGQEEAVKTVKGFFLTLNTRLNRV
jgi:hypothetical protein